MTLAMGEILLFALCPSFLIYELFMKIRRRNHLNSDLVKYLFRDSSFIDYIDMKFTAKDINTDLEYIGLNISRKSFTIIKIYLSFLIPLIYIVASILTLKEIHYKEVMLFTLSIFLCLLIFQDILIKVIAKTVQMNIRFEFISLIGAWARNIELGANIIAALEKSTEVTRGTLKKFSIQLLDDIRASTPIDDALSRFGQACRDKEIKEFCDQMASDIKDGADLSKYIADLNHRIQTDKAQAINSGTNWIHGILSGIAGVVIFFSFATYAMLKAVQTLSMQ